MKTKQIKVTLLHSTPLDVCSKAIRTCWDSHNKSDGGGDVDKKLIDRVGNKMKHKSVLNHLNFTFFIENISTKMLMATTRHDVGTEFSVQSSRYTCKKSELTYTLTKNPKINIALSKIVDIINEAINDGGSCDNISMLLPQSFQYTLTATFSLGALQHFWQLRDSKDAHYDIRELSEKLFEEIPEEYKYLKESKDNPVEVIPMVGSHIKGVKDA